jgi:serine O-acetyltransferase
MRAALHAVDRRKPSWELSRVVQALRASRASGHMDGRTLRPSDLPAREALVSVVDGLRAALFPAHFGCRDLSDESVDYFVGHTLDATLSTLFEQVQRELALFQDVPAAEIEARALLVTRGFAAELPRIRELLETDVQAAFTGDPAAGSVEEVVFCYPGITAVMHHRIAHTLYRLQLPLLARIIAELAHAETGIDLHPGAQIGPSFFIDHGTGVVVGETSILGARVRLYQGVTLGAKSFPTDERGAVIKALPRHPILEDDVIIYAGASVLGRITVGRGSTIGSNVWITRDVAPNSRVSQQPSKGEWFGGGRGI